MKPIREEATKAAYKKTRLNAEIFSGTKSRLSDYYESVRHFFDKEHVKDGYTFLDVGGAAGGLAQAIQREVANIRPTIVDPDAAAIESGKAHFPGCEFIHGYFPDALPKEKRFDVVSMQALFPQIPDWKNMLLALRERSKRYVNIELIVTLDGQAVVDKDVSYLYYLDSGERVHQVVHNIHHLINFCCIREMSVKKFSFFGYHTPGQASHSFRSVPHDRQIKGNLLLEIFEEEGENPVRMGGASERRGDPTYEFFAPELNVVIDGKTYEARR